ncbi:MAG TPA: PEP/pyruvate-binding domain-containing protein, partial [Egibacteraceae bacterium]|nr:PEP/pyruvate-binding domain-containing protein [Egibacteraceae bacterium]
MSEPVRRLAEVRLIDVLQVGGKAANLGELLAAGMRVPDGVVLTADGAARPPDERAALLRDEVAGLGLGPFAVRSSGITEDGADQSHAGMYESILDVGADELAVATNRVLASATSARAEAYASGKNERMAVLVQRMIQPVAAGVALTADPISGDRHTCVIAAVRGTAESLVSGRAMGDEWSVQGGTAVARRQPEHAIGERQALAVADAARGIAAAHGKPQDVEWAIDADGSLWIIQARPMTALPPEVSWEPGAPGAYTRMIRLAEWFAEPPTPLFESWLLTIMEDRLDACLTEWIGQRAPRPFHVVVNGWYFYSINFLSGPAMLRNLPTMLWRLVRAPRRVAGLIPPLLRHSYPVFEREWREDLLPRYRAAVAAAEERVEVLEPAALPALVDELAVLAGNYFGSITALAGSAYKMELILARFYRRHLADAVGGSHLPLLAGLAPPTDPGRHAAVSLDWWHAPAHVATTPPLADAHARVVEARLAAEKSAFAALASSPRRLRAFRQLLGDAQHLVLVREEQVRELTLAWPVMRRAVLRIGEALAARGLVGQADDVFFLTRPEAMTALVVGRLDATADVAARRATREEQARLVPPMLIGRVNPMLKRMWAAFPRLLGAEPSESALVSGTPASPGRASGAVRVVRGPDQFESLQPGEILVAPLTAPAWTPLFTRAAAVVTDVGSAAAHASIIAREYGIPAVVGCGDATARLRDGMRVTVDGSTGNVEPS